AGLALHQWGLTLPGGYLSAAARHPDDTAIIDEAGPLTFADLERRTNALANAMAAAGIGECDKVGVLCRNHRGFVETALAVAKLGGDLVLLNTGFAPRQLAEVLRQEHVVALVHDAEFTSLAGDTVPPARRFVATAGKRSPSINSLEHLATGGSPEEPSPPEHKGRITVLTSGTTGAPKGASRSQPRNADPLVSLLSRIPLRAREPTLIATPLFHAWGVVHLGLGALLGSALVLQRRFEPEATLAAIE